MGMGADELIDPAVIGQHFRVFVFFILNFTLLNKWVSNVIPVTSLSFHIGISTYIRNPRFVLTNFDNLFICSEGLSLRAGHVEVCSRCSLHEPFHISARVAVEGASMKE